MLDTTWIIKPFKNNLYAHTIVEYQGCSETCACGDGTVIIKVSSDKVYAALWNADTDWSIE